MAEMPEHGHETDVHRPDRPRDDEQKEEGEETDG
jgi:hypothetical protein